MKKGYSFNDRVDKVFGSISASSSSSWSLTDAPVEKREWNHRDNTTDRDDDQIPVFSSSATAADNIRSSIGLDSTLDHEEEEDAYDKMAQGTENCSHRCLYMKDVAAAAADHGPYFNSHNLLPKYIHHHHAHAAAARLKEEEEEEEDDNHAPMLNAAAAAAAKEASEDDNGGILKIKSILKKRKTYDDDDHHELAKPKHVRFDSTCKNVVDAPPHPDPTLLLVVSQNNRPPGVPDYILNPSKYTRYTFDGSNSTNTTTSDFLESSSVKHDPPPKSMVVFIPRKKRGNEVRKQQQSSTQACSSTIGIAAVEEEEKHEEFEEEEEKHDIDGVCTKARLVRQYRSKIDDYHDDGS